MGNDAGAPGNFRPRCLKSIKTESTTDYTDQHG